MDKYVVAEILFLLKHYSQRVGAHRVANPNLLGDVEGVCSACISRRCEVKAMWSNCELLGIKFMKFNLHMQKRTLLSK